jgi:uncharacterized protein (TIGR02145 family)
MEDFVPNTPTASPASDITVNSFTANWNFMENSNGYYLDVAEDSTFTVMVVTNHDCGNDISHPVGGLDNLTTYYYRIRAYNDVGISDNSETITVTTELEDVVDIDGNHYTYVTIGTQQWMVENLKTTKYADGTAINNITRNSALDVSTGNTYNMHIGFDSFVHTDLLIGTCVDDGATIGIAQFSTPAPTENTIIDIRISNQRHGLTPLRLRITDDLGAVLYNQELIGDASQQFFIDTTGFNNSQPLLWYLSNGDANNLNPYAVNAEVTTLNIYYNGWGEDLDGAYCWYDNDIAYKTPYGALYNWYTVNSGILAPIGWIVPSYTDYEVLWTFIGGLLTAGKKLKKSGATYWFVNTGTDDYGFAAVAGGHRQDTGVFGGDGPPTDLDSCDLWTTTEFNPGTAYYCQMNGPNDEFPTIEHAMLEKTMGMSVRCMRYI